MDLPSECMADGTVCLPGVPLAVPAPAVVASTIMNIPLPATRSTRNLSVSSEEPAQESTQEHGTRRLMVHEHNASPTSIQAAERNTRGRQMQDEETVNVSSSEVQRESSDASG